MALAPSIYRADLAGTRAAVGKVGRWGFPFMVYAARSSAPALQFSSRLACVLFCLSLYALCFLRNGPRIRLRRKNGQKLSVFPCTLHLAPCASPQSHINNIPTDYWLLPTAYRFFTPPWLRDNISRICQLFAGQAYRRAPSCQREMLGPLTFREGGPEPSLVALHSLW